MAGERINYLSFVKYDNSYPSLYLREKSLLSSLIKCKFAIEHIGSSKLINYIGRPIVDILIYVPSLSSQIYVKDVLCSKGFIFEEPLSNIDDFVVAHNYQGKTYFYIHVISKKNVASSYLSFQNKISKDKTLRETYLKYKTACLKAEPNNIYKYNALKRRFFAAYK